MTIQTSEPTSFSNYAIFPSEPDNHFRAIKGEVFTDIQSYFTQVDATYQVGFGGQVVSVRLGAAVDTDENGVVSYDGGKAEIAQAKADLDFMNQQWIEFYTAAKSALDEIPLV